MKKFHLSWLAAAATAMLVACSGGGEGDQSPRVEYGKMVTFGDSLSDVGSYNVGVVQSFGGGRYTINTGDAVNWTELLSTTLGLEALCAAQTGLNSVAELGGPVATVNHEGCYSYAQGGARVTNPVGPGNAALLALGDEGGALGQLTKPIVEQIGRHLAAVGGSFAADDLVTVMAGGNDLFMQLAAFEAMVGAGMPADQASEAVVTAMGQAGGELAAYVKTMIVANGAKRVVVVNVPDAAKAPAFLSSSDTQALVTAMLTTFNGQLAAGLAGTEDNVLLVDSYTVSQDQAAHPAQYGLTNVTTPACDLTGALASLPTSLVCTTDTLVAGVTETWQYADTVHPTPYGYKLLAQLVTAEMSKKGWL
ncbi:SGNH/GDSL hydrolase family protein [Ideonella sp. DXS29W]|uniref:SGNH/GDSL hydrolase family protein n=1 Tax=Ideonella lacteola TaxID=2984193 RepID=A0ABU9BR17_9BURK